MDSREKALICVEYARNIKAFNIRLLDVREISSLTDYILIASGRSDRQVQAIAEEIQLGMKKDHGSPALDAEGLNEGRWALLDFGDVMVHVFQQPVREFYDLDGLWCDAETLPLPEEDDPRLATGS